MLQTGGEDEGGDEDGAGPEDGEEDEETGGSGLLQDAFASITSR